MRNRDLLEQEYLFLMDLYFLVLDSQKGQKISIHEKWLFEAEVLATKLFYHIGSIDYLRHGTILARPGAQLNIYIDHPSISIIARAAFETYLTYFFLYCDPGVSVEEKRFRHSVWKMKGFIDRQGFSTFRKENLPKLEEEKKLITELKSMIENNNVFKLLDAKKQKLCKKGEWRLGFSWSDLAGIAGFNKKIFKDVYSYLCSYSHSGGLSALQISQAIKTSEQHQLSTISLHYGLILMSHFVKSYNSLFPSTRIIVASNQDLERLADKWYITWNEKQFLRPFSHDP